MSSAALEEKSSVCVCARRLPTRTPLCSSSPSSLGVLKCPFNFPPWYFIYNCSIKTRNVGIIISRCSSFMQRFHKKKKKKKKTSYSLKLQRTVWTQHIFAPSPMFQDVSWDARIKTTAQLGLHSYNMNTFHRVSHIVLLTVCGLERNLIT